MKLSIFYTRFFQEVAYHKPELLKDPKTGEKVFSRQILISFFPKRTLRFGEGSLLASISTDFDHFIEHFR
jgi:hypothetical protein